MSTRRSSYKVRLLRYDALGVKSGSEFLKWRQHQNLSVKGRETVMYNEGSRPVPWVFTCFRPEPQAGCCYLSLFWVGPSNKLRSHIVKRGQLIEKGEIILDTELWPRNCCKHLEMTFPYIVQAWKAPKSETKHLLGNQSEVLFDKFLVLLRNTSVVTVWSRPVILTLMRQKKALKFLN